MVWGFMGAVWRESVVDGLEQYFSLMALMSRGKE